MKSRLVLLLALLLAPAWAADTPEPAVAHDKLAGARAHLHAKRWADAITDLKRSNEAGNPDWNNLMGYALRKQAAPDLAGAERHYEAALRIAPELPNEFHFL